MEYSQRYTINIQNNLTRVCLTFVPQVIRDMQQYILLRLASEESLRVHMNRDTAEMLNQLHIKSNGCFLYLERVLDGISNGLIILREIKDIPGTLNGLYLWLSQRLLSTKQFLKVSETKLN